MYNFLSWNQQLDSLLGKQNLNVPADVNKEGDQQLECLSEEQNLNVPVDINKEGDNALVSQSPGEERAVRLGNTNLLQLFVHIDESLLKFGEMIDCRFCTAKLKDKGYKNS